MNFYSVRNQGIRKRKSYRDQAGLAAFANIHTPAVGALSPRGDQLAASRMENNFSTGLMAMDQRLKARRAVEEQNEKFRQHSAEVNRRLQREARERVKRRNSLGSPAIQFKGLGQPRYDRLQSQYNTMRQATGLSRTAKRNNIGDGYFRSFLSQRGIDNYSLYNEDGKLSPEGSIFNDVAQTNYAQGADPEEAARRGALALIKARSSSYQTDLNRYKGRKDLTDEEKTALTALQNNAKKNAAILAKMNKEQQWRDGAIQTLHNLYSGNAEKQQQAQKEAERLTGLRASYNDFIKHEPVDANGDPLQAHRPTAAKTIMPDGTMRFSLDKGQRMPVYNVNSDALTIDKSLKKRIDTLNQYSSTPDPFPNNAVTPDDKSAAFKNKIVKSNIAKVDNGALEVHRQIYTQTGDVKKANQAYLKALKKKGIELDDVDSPVAKSIKQAQKDKEQLLRWENQRKYDRLIKQLKSIKKPNSFGFGRKYALRRYLNQVRELNEQITQLRPTTENYYRKQERLKLSREKDWNKNWGVH